MLSLTYKHIEHIGKQEVEDGMWNELEKFAKAQEEFEDRSKKYEKSQKGGTKKNKIAKKQYSIKKR